MLLVVFIGCTGGKTADVGNGESAPAGDSSPADVGPCADGGWADVDPATSLHVRSDGSDAGTGSADSPYASLEAAVTTSRAEGGLRTILVGPGEYTTSLALWSTSDNTQDDDLQLVGCGAEDVTLAAADPTGPVIVASGVGGFALSGVTIEGGRRSLWMWNGTQARLADVRIQGAGRAGVVIDGSDSVVSLERVAIHNVVADSDDAGGYGYGLVVQGATVTLLAVDIADTVRVGMLVDGGDVSSEDLQVTGTMSAPDGTLGRAVQAQEWATVELNGGSLDYSHDAGFFALRAGGVTLRGVSISGTADATLPDSAATSGDGVVVSQGDAGDFPAYYLATVEGCTVTGSARAGMVFDGVQVDSLSGNSVISNGYEVGGVGILAQGGADLAAATDPFVDLAAEGVAPVVLNSAAVDSDPLGDP